MSGEEIEQLARALGDACSRRQAKVATAESCTGGLVAAAITDVAGSSAWFERGFVTYSNEAKQELLGVSAGTLRAFGAVSEEVAREMAAGALGRSRADASVAVTGIAGPGGGTPDKPVGLVWFAWATRAGDVSAERARFEGNRSEVRRAAVRRALEGLIELAGKSA